MTPRDRAGAKHARRRLADREAKFAELLCGAYRGRRLGLDWPEFAPIIAAGNRPAPGSKLPRGPWKRYRVLRDAAQAAEARRERAELARAAFRARPAEGSP